MVSYDTCGKFLSVIIDVKKIFYFLNFMCEINLSKCHIKGNLKVILYSQFKLIGSS